ncbi:MAG: M23 family metallopeptidase, partial [Nanoarchaeota archaeon]|nr:M23 family metallopeptidase [Nanoarchaeota archaeon]
MKQILTIILLSVISVSVGYILRTQTHEYEIMTASLETSPIILQSVILTPRSSVILSEAKNPTTKQPAPTNTRSFAADQDDNVKIPPAPKKPTLTLSAKILEQGDALIISVEHEGEVELQIQKQKIPLIPVGPKKSIGIYGIDVRKEPGTLSVSLLQDNSVIREEKVQTTKRNFPVTGLVLSDTQKKAGVTPEEAAKDIVQDDNAKLYEVLSKPLEDIYIKDEFDYPLPEKIIVGGFGNIRKSGETEIRHLGVDLDAKRGDPVKAIQNGVIRLARNLSNYGNTIVI